MNTYVHIELRAKNDTNGNPRRLSLLISNQDVDQNVIAVQDHGYEGSPTIGWGHPACSIDVPISEDQYWTRCSKLNHSVGVTIPAPYSKAVPS